MGINMIHFRSRLYQDDSRWAWKFVLRLISLLIASVAVGCVAWIIGQVDSRGDLVSDGLFYFWVPWDLIPVSRHQPQSYWGRYTDSQLFHRLVSPLSGTLQISLYSSRANDPSILVLTSAVILSFGSGYLSPGFSWPLEPYRPSQPSSLAGHTTYPPKHTRNITRTALSTSPATSPTTVLAITPTVNLCAVNRMIFSIARNNIPKSTNSSNEV